MTLVDGRTCPAQMVEDGIDPSSVGRQSSSSHGLFLSPLLLMYSFPLLSCCFFWGGFLIRVCLFFFISVTLNGGSAGPRAASRTAQCTPSRRRGSQRSYSDMVASEGDMEGGEDSDFDCGNVSSQPSSEGAGDGDAAVGGGEGGFAGEYLRGLIRDSRRKENFMHDSDSSPTQNLSPTDLDESGAWAYSFCALFFLCCGSFSAILSKLAGTIYCDRTQSQCGSASWSGVDVAGQRVCSPRKRVLGNVSDVKSRNVCCARRRTRSWQSNPSLLRTSC